MAADIVMPRLSDSMTEGTIVRWLKQHGEAVLVGDPLVEIETDKATMVYEADVAGVLLDVTAAEGDTLAIGMVIARVGESGEAGQPAPSVDAAATSEAKSVQEQPRKAVVVPALQRESVAASPLARRIASDNGVDLGTLEGTGPGGRIVKADVILAIDAAGSGSREIEPAAAQDAAAAPAGTAVPPVDQVQTAKGEVVVEKPSRLQLTVSRRMSESRATVPH